jgi:hypothetical protein
MIWLITRLLFILPDFPNLLVAFILENNSKFACLYQPRPVLKSLLPGIYSY